MSSPSGAARQTEPRVWIAGPGDALAVARLMAEFRDWMGRSHPSNDELRAGVRRLIEDPGAEYLVASIDDGGEAVAVCQLRYRYGLWHSAEDCWLEDLFVSEPVRGGGAGRALVGAAVEQARRRGCRRIELDADSDNRAALGLYESFGFSAATASGARRLMLRLFLPDS